jgi:hypothetical protein
MSGEAVVVTTLTGTFGLGVVASGVGVLVAAALVASYLQRERELAETRMREERNKLSRWKKHHAEEQGRVQLLVQQRERTRSALEGLQLVQPEQSVERDGRVRAEAFVGHSGETLETGLAPLLATIPAEAIDDPQGPFARLKRDIQQYDQDAAAGKRPNEDRLKAIRETVEMTVSAYVEDMDRRVDAANALLGEVESLLGDVICYRHLTHDTAGVAELADIEKHLLALLEARDATATSVSVLRRKFEALKRPIDEQMQLRGIREALESRLQEHLTDLGYRPTQREMGVHSTWAVPGGEQVRISVHDDLRMGFQLVHEREGELDRPMSERELAFLRQQEKRWCQDLHELVRRLNDDGFALNIDFERESSDESIPVVVVEEANEWAENESEAERPRRQNLP